MLAGFLPADFVGDEENFIDAFDNVRCCFTISGTAGADFAGAGYL